jgi:hypothetical protein
MKWRMNPRNRSHSSNHIQLKFRLPTIDIFRQRREHRVFRALIQMIPGLQRRLIDGDDEHVEDIADLVRDNFDRIHDHPKSFADSERVIER